MTPRDVHLDLNIKPNNLSIDTALPIGIMLNELLSNSIEHADPASKHLVVESKISAKGNLIFIEYKDSGKGFDHHDKSDSLGLVIIESMIEQLKGSYTRNGSTYKIKIYYKT